MKERNKVLSSPFTLFTGAIMYTFLYALLVFTFIYDYYDLELIFTFGILPTILLYWILPRAISIVEFTEDGIKKSFLKKFNRQKINWSEIQDIKIISRNIPYLFISKSIIVQLRYSKMFKNKEYIYVEYSKKVYKLLKKYSDNNIKELIDLNE